jgi:hypothetical protein
MTHGSGHKPGRSESVKRIIQSALDKAANENPIPDEARKASAPIDSVRWEAKNMLGKPGTILEVDLVINEGLPTETRLRATADDEEELVGYLLGVPLGALTREARRALVNDHTGTPPRRCPLCHEGHEQSPDQIHQFIREQLRHE